MSLIGKKVSDFKVQVYVKGEFREVTQEDILGRQSVFFFYPADFIFICPTELEDLANKYEEFQKIQYPMLADPTGKLARARIVYGRRYPEAAPEDHQEDRSWTCWKKQQKRYENRIIKNSPGSFWRTVSVWKM